MSFHANLGEGIQYIPKIFYRLQGGYILKLLHLKLPCTPPKPQERRAFAGGSVWALGASFPKSSIKEYGPNFIRIIYIYTHIYNIWSRASSLIEDS